MLVFMPPGGFEEYLEQLSPLPRPGRYGQDQGVVGPSLGCTFLPDQKSENAEAALALSSLHAKRTPSTPLILRFAEEPDATTF